MILSSLQFLVLFLSPLYIVRFHFSAVPITLLEIILWLYFLTFFIQFKKEGYKWKNFSSSFNLPILFFLISATLSIVISPDKWGAIGIFKAYFLEPVLFYFTIVYKNNKKSANAIFWGLLGAAFWLSGLSFIQKFTGQFSLASHEIVLGRVSALYNSANALAMFLGPIIFLSSGFFFQSQKNRKYLLAFLIFIFLVVIFWTKSRGGLIAEAIVFGIFGFSLMALKYRFIRKIWWTLPLILLCMTIFFFYEIRLIYGNPDSIILEDEAYSDTLQIRYNLWVGTKNLLIDHPILGAGLNGFKEIYGASYRLSSSQEQLQYPHNIILNFWTETGLYGLISFIWILMLIFKNFLKFFYQSHSQTLGLGIICAFSYIIIHGLVDVPYFKNDLSLEFWSLAGLFSLWIKNKI